MRRRLPLQVDDARAGEGVLDRHTGENWKIRRGEVSLIIF